MRTSSSLLLGVALALAFAACDGGSEGGGGTTSSAGGSAGSGGGSGGAAVVTESPYTPTPLPELDAAYLATERTIVPLHGVEGGAGDDPRDVARLEAMLAQGWGDSEIGPGQQVAPLTLDGQPAPTPAAQPALLTRFVHLADIQLADDESPARMAAYDSPELTGGAFRPQEASECRILNAAVRTVNALHTKTPIDFVVLGGDNADNAQDNEIGWVLSILDGAPKVECDSGVDDDPTPGPDNDGKDPFVAPGLLVPWKWVTGNHDILNQGNFPTASRAEQAIGESSVMGTRDWSQPGGPVVTGEVIADPRRKMSSRAEMLARVHASGDGHGISSSVVSYGKAYYTFDVPGGAVRLLVVDTAAETGGAEGVIQQADVDAFVKPALDEAKAAGKLVVVTSHHLSLTDGSGFGGTALPDAITHQAWVDLLTSYDNVIMHLAGHTHVHRVKVATGKNGRKIWEMETAALSDFPFQMRYVEIWDQGPGWITVRAVPVDYATTDDPVAEDGRKRGTVDMVSSYCPDGSGNPLQRSVELWFPKPAP